MVTIPGVRHGDVIDAETNAIVTSTSDGRTMYHWLTKAQATVLEGVHMDIDRYGQPTEVVLIQDDRARWDIAKGQSEDQAEQSRSYRSIETSGGNWVRMGGGSSATFAGGFCGVGPRTVSGTTPTFATYAMPYRASSIPAESVQPGQSFETSFSAPREGAGFWEDRLTFTGVGWSTQELEINGERVTVPTVEVRVEGNYTYRDADGNVQSTFEADETRWYADGVPEPVRMVYHRAFGGDAIYRSETRITSFQAGSQVLDVGTGQAAAQYSGMNPDAKPRTFGVAPGSEGLNLTFSYEAAMAALDGDPNGVEARAWFQQHPDAYASSGDYERDVAQGRYTWSVWFADASEALIVRVEFGPNSAGIERARVLQVFNTTLSREPPAAEVVSTATIADPNTALSLARSFISSEDGSIAMGWTVYHPHGEDNQPLLHYYAGPFNRPLASDSPLSDRYVELTGPYTQVDARDGGVVGGGSSRTGCGSESKLDRIL